MRAHAARRFYRLGVAVISLLSVSDVSVQERLYGQAACFGCGPSNPKGLQLKSYVREGVFVATFRPWPEHDNGVGFLNGGMISTNSGLPQRGGGDVRGVRAGMAVAAGCRPVPCHRQTGCAVLAAGPPCMSRWSCGRCLPLSARRR